MEISLAFCFVSFPRRFSRQEGERRSTGELNFSLFNDGFGDFARHLSMVDWFRREDRNRRRRERLHRSIGILRRFGLDGRHRFFAGVEERIIADEQRWVAGHGGKSLRLDAVKTEAGDGSRDRHHLRLDHQRHRIRASSDQSEFDVAAGSVEKRECFGVREVGDIGSLDVEEDVTALQTTLSRGSRSNPLYDQRGVEILATGESEAPRGRQGVPVNLDFHLITERHPGGGGGGGGGCAKTSGVSVDDGRLLGVTHTKETRTLRRRMDTTPHFIYIFFLRELLPLFSRRALRSRRPLRENGRITLFFNYI